MITGEFLVADDLCQAGRLVAPGETLILRSADRQLVDNEIEWVEGKMKEADRLLFKLSKLVPMRDGPELERVFEAMINWTPEVVKYGLMASFLHQVDYELKEKGKTDIFARSRFTWSDYNVVSDCIDFLRVVRVEQLKKFLDFAFNGEEHRGADRVFWAAVQMSGSMRKKKS